MLIEVLLAFALQAPVSQAPELDISGAHIGLSYSALRNQFPNMACEVSCSDQSAKLHGLPGNLWVGIGNGAVNQVAFRFKPTLTTQQATAMRAKYVELYGEPTRSTTYGACQEWDRKAGAIVLCVSGGLSLTYWKDEKWGVTTSVIPSGT